MITSINEFKKSILENIETILSNNFVEITEENNARIYANFQNFKINFKISTIAFKRNNMVVVNCTSDNRNTISSIKKKNTIFWNDFESFIEMDMIEPTVLIVLKMLKESILKYENSSWYSDINKISKDKYISKYIFDKKPEEQQRIFDKRIIDKNNDKNLIILLDENILKMDNLLKLEELTESITINDISDERIKNVWDNAIGGNQPTLKVMKNDIQKLMKRDKLSFNEIEKEINK